MKCCSIWRWVKYSWYRYFICKGQWEGTWERERRTQKVREETSRLTLTSAFLFRRLLAAAERQNDTPSDGRVHIIHPLMSPRLPQSVHTAAGAVRMHGLRICLLIRAPRTSKIECQRQFPLRSGCFPPLTGDWGGGGEKSSPCPVKSIKISIPLAPPHPAQLAKALDKQRTSGKRGEKVRLILHIIPIHRRTDARTGTDRDVD